MRDDPIMKTRYYIDAKDRGFACAHRLSGQVDFYYDYSLIDSSEGKYFFGNLSNVFGREIFGHGNELFTYLLEIQENGKKSSNKPRWRIWEMFVDWIEK